jgi:hypothetical protein
VFYTTVRGRAHGTAAEEDKEEASHRYVDRRKRLGSGDQPLTVSNLTSASSKNIPPLKKGVIGMFG